MTGDLAEPRLLVITNGNYFASLILSKVLARWHQCISGVLIITGDYKGRSGLKALWELGKVTALPYLLYKVFVLVFCKISEKIRPGSSITISKAAWAYGIPVRAMASVKSHEAIAWVESQHPDLIVSVSCPQMIGRRILSSARLGGVNIHSSLLPTYAGLAPYYWVLSRGEKETGITAHNMTLKFDEGNILGQRRTAIQSGETAFHLFARLARIGSDLLVESVQARLNGEEGTRQDLSKYTYFSNPDMASYFSLKRNGYSLVKAVELLSILRV